MPSAQNLFPHIHQANYPLTLILCLVKVRTNPSPGSLCFFLVDAQTLAVKYWKGVWLFEAVWLSSETTSPSIKPSLRCVLVISFFWVFCLFFFHCFSWHRHCCSCTKATHLPRWSCNLSPIYTNFTSKFKSHKQCRWEDVKGILDTLLISY